MVNSEKRAGVDTFLLYGVESTFGTAVTPDKAFGIVQTFSPTINRNITYLRGLKTSTAGGRNVQAHVGGKFESGFDVEMKPTAFEWLEQVMGATRTGAGSGGDPFIYGEGDNPSSITVSNNIDNNTTDREEKYLGSVIDEATIKCAVGEEVNATLTVLCGKFEKDTALATNVALTHSNVYTWSGATLELPDSSPISQIIDNVEIAIKNNFDMIYGLGSFTAQNALARAREYTVSFTVKYLDETFIDLINGSSTSVSDPDLSATFTVRFSNEQSQSIEFKFTNLLFDELSTSNENNEVLNEELKATARTLSIEEVIS